MTDLKTGVPYKKQKKTKFRQYKSRSKSKTKPAVSNAQIARVVRGMAETKNLGWSFALLPLCIQPVTTTLTTNAAYITPCPPSLAAGYNSFDLELGTGDGYRIGDTVHMTDIRVSYVLFPLQYNATTNIAPYVPKVVKVYFFRPRAGEFLGGPTGANYFGNNPIFFQSLGVTQPSSTDQAAGFAGNIIDVGKYVDEENYELLKVCEHKIAFASSGSDGPTSVANGFTNAFKYYDRRTVHFKTPELIQWDKNNTQRIQPIYMLTQVVFANGSGMLTSQQTVGMQVNVMWTYKDF